MQLAFLPLQLLLATAIMSQVSSQVSIINDIQLLASIRNQSIDVISLAEDVILGTSWAYIDPPITISRNLTITSEGGMFVIDLNYYADVFFLGPRVILTYANITLRRKKRKHPLLPGMDSIVGGAPGSLLFSNSVNIETTCCLPASEWHGYLGKNGLNISNHSSQPDACLMDSCWDQMVTFDRLVSTAFSSPTNDTGLSVSYMVLWNNVSLLCPVSVPDECVAENGANSCLESCIDHIDDNPFQGGGGSGASSGSFSLTAVTSFVIWAPLLAAVILGLIFAILVWQQRVAFRRRADLNKKATVPLPAAGDVELAGLTLVARGTSSGLPGGNVSSTSSGFTSGATLLTTREQQLRDHAFVPSRSPHTTHSGGEPVADLYSPTSQQLECISESHSGPRTLELRPGSTKANSLGVTGEQRDSTAPSTAGGAGSTAALWASGSNRGDCLGARGFDAAAAIAHLATTSNNGLSPGIDDLAPVGGAVDLNKRVQQLAEELLLTGAQDEKLVLGRPIGRGAFGIVYHGWWRNLEVAVKTVLLSQHDPGLQEKALMEAALSSSVVHPNVVSIYHYDLKPVAATATHGTLQSSLRIDDGDSAPVDWRMYLVQELCQISLAQTLEKWVFHDQRTELPRMDLIVAVLLDVAHGCTHIHSKNILWGDLKPENVLIKMEPSRLHGIVAKISDFGLSTIIDPSKSHVSNYNKGTLGYSAPEVVRAHQATKKSDVFSFGVLMQAMMTRSSPVLGRNEEGGTKINQNFWRPIFGAPPAFMELRRRCLDRDPNKRPTFAEIEASLQIIYDWGMSQVYAAQQAQKLQQMAAVVVENAAALAAAAGQSHAGHERPLRPQTGDGVETAGEFQHQNQHGSGRSPQQREGHTAEEEDASELVQDRPTPDPEVTATPSLITS